MVTLIIFNNNKYNCNAGTRRFWSKLSAANKAKCKHVNSDRVYFSHFNFILLKQVILFCCCLLFSVLLYAQLPGDSTIGQQTTLNDTLKKDSTLKIDSITAKPLVIIATPLSKYNQTIEYALSQNLYLNTSSAPVSHSSKQMAVSFTDFIFYVILSTLLLLAFLRFFYTRYFNNLFRVFFNTSLRQSQLTDQLLQAQLASMLFNLFFVITGGLYIYFLLVHYKWVATDNAVLVIGASIFILTLIYLVKYLTLKFTGWLTGNKEVANTYLFIIFLINKILSVILLPFVILMAFAMPTLQSVAVTLSLLVIVLMFLLRFLRSFGLLQHKIKVSWFHFFLFIGGVELLPILLIYKGMVIVLTK